MSLEDYTLNELMASVEIGYELTQTIAEYIRDRFFRGNSIVEIATELVYNEYPIESLNNKEKIIDLCALAVNSAINGNHEPELGIIYDGVISDEECCLFELDKIEKRLRE